VEEWPVEQAAAGEEIIIAKAGKPMARLVSLRKTKPKKRKPGALKGRISIADDFDDPLPESVLREWYGDRPPR
jgi:antitoxin (DNA-binding transcriptional repressor) of toxin-antitoxin stability system